jgi:hypothetical protein
VLTSCGGFLSKPFCWLDNLIPHETITYLNEEGEEDWEMQPVPGWGLFCWLHEHIVNVELLVKCWIVEKVRG